LTKSVVYNKVLNIKGGYYVSDICNIMDLVFSIYGRHCRLEHRLPNALQRGTKHKYKLSAQYKKTL